MMCLYYVRKVTKRKLRKKTKEIFSIGHGGQLKKRNVIPPKIAKSTSENYNKTLNITVQNEYKW